MSSTCLRGGPRVLPPLRGAVSSTAGRVERCRARAHWTHRARHWPRSCYRPCGQGLALGRTVGSKIVAYAERDGASALWRGNVPPGPQYWKPRPGAVEAPWAPLAGTWKTWFLASPSEFRPPPPPRYGSKELRNEAIYVMTVGNHLSDRQKEIADYWFGQIGGPQPPGLWNQIALTMVTERRLSFPAIARIFAVLNMGLADAGVAAWDCKYTYLSPRPENVILDLGLAKSWKPHLTTPPFPSYVSAHSTYSGAASVILSYFFPGNSGDLRDIAEQALSF